LTSKAFCVSEISRVVARVVIVFYPPS